MCPAPDDDTQTEADGLMRIEDFREVWLVQFEYERVPGERPAPVSLVATEHRTPRVLRLAADAVRLPDPPFPVGPEALFVAYDAAPAVGIHLALGWPAPANVLDLHAEFRCLTAGLDLEGDFDLPHALGHFGLAGDSPNALARLLETTLPRLDLPRALLRGRYMAAVARMEAVGVPIDMESLGRLRDGWGRIQDALVQEVDQHYGVFDGHRFNPRRWTAWVNHHGIPWPRLSPGRLDLKDSTFRDMASVYPEVRPMHELRATLSQMRLFRLAVGSDGRNRTQLRPFASKTGRNQPSTAEFVFGPATWLRGLIRPEEGAALAYIDYEQQEFGIAAALSGDRGMQEAYRTGDPYLTFAKQAGAVPRTPPRTRTGPSGSGSRRVRWACSTAWGPKASASVSTCRSRKLKTSCGCTRRRTRRTGGGRGRSNGRRGGTADSRPRSAGR